MHTIIVKHIIYNKVRTIDTLIEKIFQMSNHLNCSELKHLKISYTKFKTEHKNKNASYFIEKINFAKKLICIQNETLLKTQNFKNKNFNIQYEQLIKTFESLELEINNYNTLVKKYQCFCQFSIFEKINFPII